MKVRLYQLSKRNRSTMRPTGTYKELDCQLKDRTTITSPTLILQSTAPVFYNYAYIPEWKRYYFITNTASIRGMWEVDLTVDVLATFKDYILNTEANILYATGSNKDIPDTRIPVKASVKVNSTSASLGFSLNPSVGRIILGITGKGSFGTYILQNRSDLNDLLDGVDNWWNVQDQLEAAKQLFFGGSASECLKAALEIPIQFSSADHGTLEDLYLGSYPCMKSDGSTHIKGYKVSDPILDYVANVSIPWEYSDWRNISQYTDVILYIPLIGVLSLPATEIRNETLGLQVEYKINITSGDVAVLVKGKTINARIYATASSNCALNTPFGSTGIDTNKATQAIVSGIGTLIAGVAAVASEGLTAVLGAAIGGGIASTASSIIGALGGNSSGSGGLGGGASGGLSEDEVYCFVVSKELTDTQTNFNKIMGKPFMGVAKVGNFTGYIQTDGFQLASDFAYDAEKDKVNQLLDTGIYIE